MSRRGAGEGSIYERADGRWAAVVDMGWRDGKRQRKFVYGKTRREAARKLAAALKAHADGTLRTDERITVEQFVPMWLEAIRPTIKPRTWHRYEQMTRVHIVPHIGKVQLKRLSPQHLQRLYANRLSTGLSGQTVLTVHRTIHRMLGHAVKWDLSARNVAQLVDPPRAQRYEARTLTATEAQRLLEVVRGDRLEALYVVALATGMRAGELLGLKWCDVDLETGVVAVRRSLQMDQNKQAVIGDTKTLRSQRRIMLIRSALDVLRAHRLRQEAEAAAPRHWNMWDEQDLVFPNTVGRPMTAQNLLRRSFRPALERAGLPPIRFHDLRHTVATLLLAQDVHPKIVSEMLGHTQIGITLDLYSHVTPTMQDRASSALETVFGSQLGSQGDG